MFCPTNWLCNSYVNCLAQTSSKELQAGMHFLFVEYTSYRMWFYEMIEIPIDMSTPGHFKLRVGWHFTYFNFKAIVCQHANWSEVTLTQTSIYSLVYPRWIRKHSPISPLLWNLPYWSGTEPHWIVLFMSWCRLQYCVPLYHAESGAAGVID